MGSVIDAGKRRARSFGPKARRIGHHLGSYFRLSTQREAVNINFNDKVGLIMTFQSTTFIRWMQQIRPTIAPAVRLDGHNDRMVRSLACDSVSRQEAARAVSGRYHDSADRREVIPVFHQGPST